MRTSIRSFLLLGAGLVVAAPARAVAPLASPPFVAESNVASQTMGASAHAAGDINGDQNSDFIIGAAGVPGGKVYLYTGNMISTPSLSTWAPVGGDPQSRFGWSVACAGDVNGDGYGDVVVGDPATLAAPAPGNTANGGAVYVYFGSAGGLPPQPSQMFYANGILPDAGANDGFGETVAPAGDFNHDGYDDVLVGAPLNVESGQERGRFVLLLGGPNGLAVDGVGGYGSPFSRMGRGLCAAGDLNGDGFDDFAVGLPGRSEQGFFGDLFQGQVIVYYGHAGGLVGATTTTIPAPGGVVDDAFGFSVSPAGDVDGDGYADLLIGAPKRTMFGVARAGIAFLYKGGAGGVQTLPIWSDYGLQVGSEMGKSVATAGDFDGDGRADVVVGEPGWNGGTGRANVWTYSLTFAIGYLDYFTQLTGDPSEATGSVVGTVGDFNRDGYSDVFATSPLRSNGQASEGGVRVWFGHGRGVGLTRQRSNYGNSSFAWGGSTVAGGGDLNGDGYADYIVTEPRYSCCGLTTIGRVNVYMGGLDGPGAFPSWSLDGQNHQYGNLNQFMGSGAAMIGDVDGNGYDDMAVGYANTAMIFYGNANGDLGTTYDNILFPDSTFTPDNNIQEVSMSSAGDVNGDGYGDFIYGVGGAFGGNGIASLWLGGPGGLPGYPFKVWRGTQPGQHLGSSVAYAGDVNGDGYGDILIGSSYYDYTIFFHGIPIETLADAGKVELWLGNASGVPTLATTFSGDNAFEYMGWSCSTAGDINADGYDDIILGAPGWGNEGRALVFKGSSSGIPPLPIASALTLGQQNAFYAQSVACAGDVDNDGYSDVIVGAPTLDNTQTNEGAAVIYHGSASGIDPGVPDNLLGGAPNIQYGWSVAGAGDVNGDGFSDVVIGAPFATNDQSQQGAGYLHAGNTRFGKLRRIRQTLSYGGQHLAVRGKSSTSHPTIEIWAHSAAGRKDQRIIVEKQPPGVGFPDLAYGPCTGCWTLPLPPGQDQLLTSDATAMFDPSGKPVHWRARLVSRSPYFPRTPWYSPATDWETGADLRADPAFVATPPPAPSARLELANAFPSPMHTSATVRFSLPRAAHATLALTNVAGRRVRTLVDAEVPAGETQVTWDGRDDAGQVAPAGIYFLSVDAIGERRTGRIVVLR